MFPIKAINFTNQKTARTTNSEAALLKRVMVSIALVIEFKTCIPTGSLSTLPPTSNNHSLFFEGFF